MTQTPLPELATLRQAAAGLDAFIDDNLPLARSAGLKLACVNERGLALSAPLAINNNHHGSAFGGSLYVAGLAAGWGLVHLLQQISGLGHASLMVKQAEVRYLRPVLADFEALAALPESAAFERFAAGIQTDGAGELSIDVQVMQGERLAFEMHCEFAARVL